MEHGGAEVAGRALITGGSGLIGRALLARLGGGVVLSRDPERAARHLGGSSAGVTIYPWEPEVGPPPLEAFRGIDVVFHLAGEPVANGRWTAGRKRRIRDSRVVGTRHLVAGLAALDARPRVLVSASAIGYYGDRGDEGLDETSSPGSDFLAEVCVAWEREAAAAAELGMRVVRVRIGLVLAPDGGALARMMPVFRVGLGGRLGSGRQWISWIHIADVVGLFLHATRREDIVGPLNAVAPNPVTNAEFTRALAHALGRPAFLRIPRFALRAAFGEMADILISSQRVLPRVAQRTGYEFWADGLEFLASFFRPDCHKAQFHEK